MKKFIRIKVQFPVQSQDFSFNMCIVHTYNSISKHMTRARLSDAFQSLHVNLQKGVTPWFLLGHRYTEEANHRAPTVVGGLLLDCWDKRRPFIAYPNSKTVRDRSGREGDVLNKSYCISVLLYVYLSYMYDCMYYCICVFVYNKWITTSMQRLNHYQLLWCSQ